RQFTNTTESATSFVHLRRAAPSHRRLTHVMNTLHPHPPLVGSAEHPVQILKSSYEFPPLGGGGAKVVMGIAKRLAARGHRVEVVTMAYRGLSARDVVAGINVSRIPGMRLRLSSCSFIEMIPYVLLAPWRIIRLARSGNYAFSHTHFIFPDGVVAWVVKRI